MTSSVKQKPNNNTTSSSPYTEPLFHEKNWIKEAIRNNDPIESKLHVIAVISNPCNYKRRYKLMDEFKQRFRNEETDAILYIVELVYGNQKFKCTEQNNPHHLQLRTNHAVWHKENMINLGVKHLLPQDWKAFAWIDSDLSFESLTWCTDTLKLLNGAFDIVQLFSQCCDLNEKRETMNTYSSFGYGYTKLDKYNGIGANYMHCGYCWAITRKMYERIGGLYETSIIGSGDYQIACALIDRVHKSVPPECCNSYKQDLLEYQEKLKTARLGYVPGTILHYFHGTKENRKYVERNSIIIKHQFDPIKDIVKDQNGIIQLNKKNVLINDIFDYFTQRKEDDL